MYILWTNEELFFSQYTFGTIPNHLFNDKIVFMIDRGKDNIDIAIGSSIFDIRSVLTKLTYPTKDWVKLEKIMTYLKKDFDFNPPNLPNIIKRHKVCLD